MGPSDIPSQHPALQIHLADASNYPIIASEISEADTANIEHLTGLFSSAQDTAARLGLGTLKRITIQGGGNGSSVVQSCISPRSGSENSVKAKGKISQNSRSTDSGQVGGEPASDAKVPPTLFATIVTSSDKDSHEAREVLKELETVGEGLQEVWEAESHKKATQVQNEDTEPLASE